MSVKLAAAHIDERGKASGGRAGDQTGREVCVRNYYVHSKGWRVFRPKSARAAERIAWDARAACDNKCIGYDQGERTTLYSAAKPYGFDCAAVTKPCETDCSDLVRVCCAYAGITLPVFTTASEAGVLLASGAFTELTGEKYTKSSAYLRRGDILVTRTKGHTEIVLNDGPKAATEETGNKLGDRILKNGMSGPDVKQLQTALIRLGYSLGKWGADGEYGDATELAVRRFQTQEDLKPDGQFGPLSLAALETALARLDAVTDGEWVHIYGGSCYVRTEPSTGGEIRGVATEGARFPYAGETDGGWLKIVYKDKAGWVSGKYGRLEA